MSDPNALTDAVADAQDAFTHAHGSPEFDPGIDASSKDAGVIQLQKGCQLLVAADVLRADGDHFTSVLEHAFAAIERTLEGYLVSIAGADPGEFHDHTRVYDRAGRASPIDATTLESIRSLYAARRTEHYYGSSITTRLQSTAMLEVATTLHDYLVAFDAEHERHCQCRPR